METVSSSTNALQDVASVDDFLNAAATETVPLFEHLDFEFLLEYDVFAPSKRVSGGSRSINPSSNASATASSPGWASSGETHSNPAFFR